ncbi:DinB family protein [Mariniluteicoccus endophyticus]
MDHKETLHHYLKTARGVVMSKVEGLPERELRMPRTPTGTNLLGVVKHLALVEVGYLGNCMGRPSSIDVWAVMGPDAEDNADMYARADESAESVLAMYRTVWAHDDETIATMDLDAEAQVPWWGEPAQTLQRLLVHVIAETNRHAGQLDILRESIDGAVGYDGPGDNLPPNDEQWWADYRARLIDIAGRF